MSKVFEMILAERVVQRAKWPHGDRHADATWLTILTEEVGEVAKAILESGADDVRDELVQVAAVAVAWLEGLEKRKLVRVQPHGDDGYRPAVPIDCPYAGGNSCVSRSGGSLCGSYGGLAEEGVVICEARS